MKLLAFIPIGLFSLSALAILACAPGSGPYEPSGVGAKASAEVMDAEGASMGKVVLTQGPRGVLISADLSNLEPGGHGFHIHSVGACTPDFSAAGGHFNPSEVGHGPLHSGGHHAGDLPNIYAAADGTAKADYYTDEVTLDSGPDHSLFDADNSAIIVHEKPDAYGEDAGSAGARIACGVIQRN